MFSGILNTDELQSRRDGLAGYIGAGITATGNLELRVGRKLGRGLGRVFALGNKAPGGKRGRWQRIQERNSLKLSDSAPNSSSVRLRAFFANKALFSGEAQ